MLPIGIYAAMTGYGPALAIVSSTAWLAGTLVFLVAILRLPVVARKPPYLFGQID